MAFLSPIVTFLSPVAAFFCNYVTQESLKLDFHILTSLSNRDLKTRFLS